MFNKSWVKVGMVVLACGCLMVGCRTPRNKGGDTGTNVIGEINPPPPDRIDGGIPVADFTATNVLFDYDSFQIKPAEIAKIEKVAEYLKTNSRTRLVVEGHCDERGSREYNLALGEQRAGAVRAHLVGVGIAPERIQTKSYGKEKPANQGHDEKAWSENRRVEFPMFN
jgi:peptidoglycan-associated lipoprotein